MACILPYHSTKTFARIVAPLALDWDGSAAPGQRSGGESVKEARKWRWLKPVQREGTAVSLEVLVQVRTALLHALGACRAADGDRAAPTRQQCIADPWLFAFIDKLATTASSKLVGAPGKDRCALALYTRSATRCCCRVGAPAMLMPARLPPWPRRRRRAAWPARCGESAA